MQVRVSGAGQAVGETTEGTENAWAEEPLASVEPQGVVQSAGGGGGGGGGGGDAGAGDAGGGGDAGGRQPIPR